MSTSNVPYPGKRLGLTESGPGSVARFGRRTVAIFLDYAAATIIAMTFLNYDPLALPSEAGLNNFGPLVVFAAMQIIFIPSIGGSPGHRLLGMRLQLVGGGWTGLLRPIVRTILLVLVIPAFIWDADLRGLHDKAAGTVLIRA